MVRVHHEKVLSELLKTPDMVADSRHHAGSSVQQTMKAILEWLRQEFNEKFADEGDTIAHGKQPLWDGIHCGIYTINALAHELFEEELVSAKTMSRVRMCYFSRLAKAHNEHVSKNTTIVNDHTTHRLHYQEISSLDASTGVSIDNDISVEELEVLRDHNIGHHADVPRTAVVDGSGGPSISESTVGEELGSMVEWSTSDERTSVEPPAEPTSNEAGATRDDASMGNEVLASTHVKRTRSPSLDEPSKRPRPEYDIPSASPAIPSPVSPSLSPAISRAPSLSSELSASSSDESDNRRSRIRGRSSAASQVLKQRMQDGSLVINEKDMTTYKNKILSLDPYAEFEFGATWRVRHSICGDILCR